MTNLPRITISMPSDIEGAVNAIKASPDFKRTPKAKIVCSLIRKGLKAENEKDADTDDGEETS